MVKLFQTLIVLSWKSPEEKDNVHSIELRNGCLAYLKIVLKTLIIQNVFYRKNDDAYVRL